jgi:putative membrane protein insertion efficiency factor
LIESKKRSIAARILLVLLSIYRAWISPRFGLACRFLPSCSQYSWEAIQRHGALRGVGLALWRLSRCHPLGGSGLDPVPGRGDR